jgi:diguanylate cyclase (GGDEF)-like protein
VNASYIIAELNGCTLMAEPIAPTSSSRVFNWSTDLPAVLVIALGICIALVLNDIALRLIGVCVAILGGVALFVLIGQRAKAFANAAPQEAQEDEGFRIIEPSKNVSREPNEASNTEASVHAPSTIAFGDDDDIPDATVNPFHAASQHASSHTSRQETHQENKQETPPQHAAPPAEPRKAAFTFDDNLDDDQDFSALEGRLSLAPDKFVPTERPLKAASQTDEDGLTTTQRQPATHTLQSARKAVLSFDDDAETFTANADFQPLIPMEEAQVRPLVSPEAQQQSYSYLPSKEELNEPIPTPELSIGESFVDGDEEIRIVGKRKGDGRGDVEHPPIDGSIGGSQTAQKAIPQPKATLVASADIPNTEATDDHPDNPNDDAHIFDRVRAAETSTREHQATPPEQIIAQTAAQGSLQSSAQAASQAPLEAASQAALAHSLQGAHKRKTLTIQRSEIVDETPDAARKEPRKEFDYLLQRVLLLIRSAVSARTAGFVWVHFERQQFIMETCLSDDEVIPKNQILTFSPATTGFASDALTAIAQSGAPEIYSEIAPEAASGLLRYYGQRAEMESTQPVNRSVSRSFIGVPVFSGGVVVGILFADSTEQDAYDEATVSFFGHFTKLISGLIQGYNEKYELLQAARTLEAVETFRSLTARYDNAPEDICSALIESVSRLVPASSLGTVIFNERGNCWYLSDARNSNGSKTSGGEVYLDNSLVGKVITSGKPLHTLSIENLIRVTPTEPKVRSGSFVAVPLVSTSRCYGALYVEDSIEISSGAASSKAPVRYTKQDIELLQTAAEYAGTAIEQIQLKHFLHQHSLVDDATDILNKAGFLQRAQEEFTRASDVQLAFSVVLIGADNYASFATQSPQFNEAVVMHIAQMARKSVRVYDIIGRYSDSVVAVGMIEKNTQESQFWAEKVRREIAGTMFSVSGKQYAVTVSIGIAEYLKQKSLPELMISAEKAFAIAREKSNAVSIFS